MGLEHTAPRFPHWNYFIALEEDLERASRYVELVEANEATYSLEFAHLLFAAASEVETVMTLLCRLLDPQSRTGKFAQCTSPLRKEFPRMWEEQVKVPRFGLTLRPWDEWRNNRGVPFWWKSYNHVKHQRHSSFSEATMKNAVNALAALYLMVLELICRERRGGRLFLLDTREVMMTRVSPRARLFEVGGRR
jgi:hypothetical protein